MFKQLLLALLILAPLSASAQHIHTGLIPSRQPVHYGTELGWYHVVCFASQRQPCGVSAHQATLLAGGGDRLDPGSSTDIFGSGIWATSPLYGGFALMSVEMRSQPSVLTIDPLRQATACTSFKAMPPRPLAPNQWHTIASNILGMVSWELRAEGQTIYIDSHPDLTKPPGQGGDAGAGWQLRPTDAPHLIPGNQNLYAYTYPPSIYTPGAVLHMVKLTCGADFVVRPQ